MQATWVVDAKCPDTDSLETNFILRVVIAYHDLDAGKRAMDLLAGLNQHAGGAIEFQPLPWSFQMLADLDWRAVAAHDAVRADVLILTTSGLHPLPAYVVRWTEGVLRRKQGTASVVVLLGARDNPDKTGTHQLRALEDAARQAGLAFFAPLSHHAFEETIARIHERAETITPFLEEILHHNSASPQLLQNWG